MNEIKLFQTFTNHIVLHARKSVIQVANDYVVKISGLPYETEAERVRQFFDGLDIPNNGILFTKNVNGGRSGQVYFIYQLNKLCSIMYPFTISCDHDIIHFQVAIAFYSF